MKTTKSDIERVLWKACDSFRGKIDSSRYKDYILSMLFVKYLSDTFDESVKELEKDYSGIRLERQIKNLPFFLEKKMIVLINQWLVRLDYLCHFFQILQFL